ncbi:MAG: hypothetical protein M3237_10220 [Actinomycetota bacterium]|nr:hypothetical protein [Actinomycetota bacterium]
MRTIALATASCLLLFAGCSSETAADPPDAAAASDTTSPVSEESDRQPACFNPHGGECLGPLEAGTYETSVFTPALRYTVPGGWVNAEDLPGNFLLHRAQDGQEGIRGGSYIGVWSGIRASSADDDCPEEAQAGVGTSPEELVAWFRSRPGLRVTRPKRVEVGGLDGLAVDITLRKGYRSTCPWSEGHPAVPLIIGSGISHLYHVVLPGLTVRLVFLSWGETNVTIEITSVHEQLAAQRYFAITAPIVDSFEFAHDGRQANRAPAASYGRGPGY